jgi:zinc and cadmium transporter
MKIWIYTIISVILVSLVSLVGIFTLSLRKDALRRITLFLVSFAAGGLFGDAFIHLLPESFEKLQNTTATSLYVILGIVVFFVLEKFIRWRHCHTATSQGHLHPIVTLNLIGDGIHNLIDGMAIGASFLADIPLGIATTLAVVLHEIPQEMGDFGVLVHGGLPVKRALLYNFFFALIAVIGALIALLAGRYLALSTLVLLPITAGGFIYIAGSDLIPELHGTCDIKISLALGQFIAMLAGILLMALLLLFE